MAVQIITDNDSIYDYWYEDGQLYGRRKSNKIPFKINSDKANSIIFPQVQAKGVDPTKPTSTLVYHSAKYKEMPTAKKISTPINSIAAPITAFLISNLKKVYLLIIRIIQVQILLVNLFLVNIQIFLMEV